MGNILSGINWQVIAQLISLGVIVLLGPVVIVLLSLRKGNL
nr:Ycf12 [Erythrotrichia foliiformis]